MKMASTSTATPTPILPKLAPQPARVPYILVPVNFGNFNPFITANRQHGYTASSSGGQVSLTPITLSAAAQAPSPMTAATTTTVGLSYRRHPLSPPIAPPLPPPSLLRQKVRRRIPILIDQKSLKKNLQLNKQTLQTKLASRPEPTQLFERGILRSEEEKLRRFQHRENIRSHIESRPTRETLVTQGILLSEACVDPLIQVRGQLLKRNKLVDNLNSKLRKRPGPLELVNRKILQVDAELEQAIQEGRFPFTPPLSEDEGDETSTSEMISTLIPHAPLRHDESESLKQYSSSTASLSAACGPKAKVRKKSSTQLHRTPYENNSAINSGKIIKLKTALSNNCGNGNNKRPTPELVVANLETSTSANLNESLISSNNGISPMETDDIQINGDDGMHPETNYESNLKQQQLYLQWQEDHFKNATLDTHHAAVTPAMSSTTSNCSTPLQSNDTQSIHSSRSSFSVSSSAHSCSGNNQGNNSNSRFSSIYSPSVSPSTITTIQNNNNISDATLIQVSSLIDAVAAAAPRSKLSDFKVQDLKIECKKRSLPVSGAKPQLLERLKPYEEIILATLSPNLPTTVSGGSTTTMLECSNDGSSTSAGTCQNSCNHNQTIYSTTSTNSKPLVPAQDVINDYLQQYQPQTNTQNQKPLVLQLPPNSKPPQLVQVLVDSNGTVVGVAAMPQTISSTATTKSSPTIAANPCFCAQCKKTPGKNHAITEAAVVIQSTTSEQQQSTKINEPTFSFSQMGSGGQFTLANSSPILNECRNNIASNCAGCIAAATQSSSKTIKIVSSSEIPSSSVTSSTRQCPQTAPVLTTNQNITLCPTPQNLNRSMNNKNNIPKSHANLQKSESNSSTVEQTVAAVAHRRHSIPTSVFLQQQSSEDIITEKQIISPENSINQEAVDDIDAEAEEDIDPSILLTAKTFSQHEENLRHQQKLIDDLQAELAKAQEQLRREHKLISAAKKIQQLRNTDSSQSKIGKVETLLNNLDIKQINMHHLQRNIKNKTQLQNSQIQTSNYQNLLQSEHKIQEEVHVEQAIQDIVRLIKQDGRTALLIVQLLRRYQLERNHQLQQQQATAIPQSSKQQGSCATTKSATTTTSGGSNLGQNNELKPGSNNHSQEYSGGGRGRISVMSSKSQNSENNIYQNQKQSIENNNSGGCRGCRKSSAAAAPAQIVVIDDSPATSPAPTITTVGESLLQKQQSKDAPVARSKSQNPRSNKRKSNGSRSIWAKTNLIEKSASLTNASTNPSSKVVDMEEIFRTVINDTRTPTSSASTAQEKCQAPQILTIMDASSELVPQLHGFHLVANSSDESSNSAIADDQQMEMDHQQSFSQISGYTTHDYILQQQQQPMQTEICSTTAIFIQPENISSCHVDCYSKPRNNNSPERVEIIGNGQNEYIQATTNNNNIHQHFEFPQNDEDFEDLMDVLRDDQECINNGLNLDEDENCGREILGYTSAELATFLAAECENSVVANNIVGNQMYETYVVQQQIDQNNQDGGGHYVQADYQQCIQSSQGGNINYEVQGNIIEYETPGHSTLQIEPHQEQAINDILNGDMIDTSVEWFDNYFQSPLADRQMASVGTCGGNRPSNNNNPNSNNNIQRPMDTFV